MQYRKFGALDAKVSVIGFGGGAISGEGGGYGFGHISEQDSIAVLKHACDRGINLFDTAPPYGWGLSEQRMGKAFRGMRDKVFLVSKAGVVNRGGFIVDNSPANVQKMLDQSLHDLQTDYLDLYLLHWPDPNVPFEDVISFLARKKQEGKVRAIGLCNHNADAVRRAQKLAHIEAIQDEFNLFNRKMKDEMFPVVREFQLGAMSYGTLDRGILTGRVTRDREFDSVDVRSRQGFAQRTTERRFAAVERLEALIDRTGYSMLDLAIGFVLSYPEMTTALCGMKSVEQVDSACAAADHLPPSNLTARAIRIAEQA